MSTERPLCSPVPPVVGPCLCLPTLVLLPLVVGPLLRLPNLVLVHPTGGVRRGPCSAFTAFACHLVRHKVVW